MALSSRRDSDKARASPTGDVRRRRPDDARNGQGLPAPGRGRLKKQVHIRLGTLNIGTMTGRSRELSDALKSRRIDIACIQETKWKGAKSRDIGEGYKLLYNGITTQNGIGIIVNEKLREKITNVDRISDRLMSLKIESEDATLRIISAYAPQANCPNDIKDEFWQSLDDHLRSFGPEEYIAIGGDLNGHVGQDREDYEQHHGGHGYGVRNEDGFRILDFAEVHNLAIANTYFSKRHSHLVTYSSGGRETQIDYWLIRRPHLQMVVDTKVIPSDNIAPQHRLLVMDLRLDLGQQRPMRIIATQKIKWWRMSERKQELAAAFTTVDVDLNQPVEIIWSQVTDQMRKIAIDTLGKTKLGQKFIDKQIWWWNEDVQVAVKKKKVAFKIWRQARTAENYGQYKTLKSIAKRAVAAAKAAHYDQLYEELDTRGGENKIYRLAAARNQSTQDIGQIKHIKDDNHQILRDTTAILQRWSDYFSKVSNEEFAHPPIPNINSIPGAIANITVAEVVDAINKMKNGKATGPDDVPVDVWKLLGPRAAMILDGLFNRIIEEREIPRDWLSSITVPIWKNKGDVAECSNYRPIRLLCHTMKIFERIIDVRLRKIITITPNQCGFVKGCGTIDAIHAVRLLLERHREKNKTVHMAFLDLEKAFDRVPHDLIWHAIRSHGVPEAYIDCIKLLYRNTTSVVRTPVGTSPSFPVTVGVHQGSALSPLLFVLCMDTVTADLQLPHPWSLLYADDVLLANVKRDALQDDTQRWTTRLGEYGMRLNIKKTEYLEAGPQTDGTINVGGEDLKKVQQFKYLGSTISSDGDIMPDVRSRINAAWMKWRRVTGVLCDRRMPNRLKSKVYRTIIRPVALYGSECWPVTSKHERAVATMEMRMIRWSLGLTRWDRITNDEVRKRMGVAPIVEKMREGRLRWYGHVTRSGANTVATVATQLSPPGRRPRGRPKKRWMDRIREDMKITGVNPKDALDRAEWRRKCRRADPVWDSTPG